MTDADDTAPIERPPATLDDVLGALVELIGALRPALSPATRPTWDQQRWAPAPDAFGADAPVLQAAVDPDGTPSRVAANALIESAWGNAVADSIDRCVGIMGWNNCTADANGGARITHNLGRPVYAVVCNLYYNGLSPVAKGVYVSSYDNNGFWVQFLNAAGGAVANGTTIAVIWHAVTKAGTT